VPITGADDIVWIAKDATTGRVISRKYLADGSVYIVDATNGVFKIYFYVDDTSPAFGVGSTTETMTYPWELRIYLGTTQEVIADGNLIIEPTISWAENEAMATDRVVYVQGRF
jgi:hypothetical protein